MWQLAISIFMDGISRGVLINMSQRVDLQQNCRQIFTNLMFPFLQILTSWQLCCPEMHIDVSCDRSVYPLSWNSLEGMTWQLNLSHNILKAAGPFMFQWTCLSISQHLKRLQWKPHCSLLHAKLLCCTLTPWGFLTCSKASKAIWVNYPKGKMLSDNLRIARTLSLSFFPYCNANLSSFCGFQIWRKIKK